MSTAVDIVCQMTVDVADTTPHVDYEGTRYYFCCAGCAKSFQENPARYVNQNKV